MCIYSSDLTEYNISLLCGSVIFIALKTLEQTDKKVDPEVEIQKICSFLKLDEESMIELSRKVLELAKGFSKVYPNLTNLKKFNKFEYKPE